MKFIDKLKTLTPFSYMWFLKRNIGEAKTILDLGCEDGRLLELLSFGEKWQVTGVDIYKENVEKASRRNIFVKVIKGDVVEVSKKFVKLRKKFDVVFCSQVIEHIERKKGEQLFDLVDKLARKRIVIGTPKGFMNQPHVFLGNNPHMHHKSGWTIEDFKNHGYKVYGIGFWPIWKEEGLARIDNKLLFLTMTILGYIFSPIVYYFPTLGAGILGIKQKV
ncbi:MAG: class I SAM-dependent methyltransferase [Candidatus Daviesbacteria bacterium]|nr:class I SAM-dependent methyltransferase [Candidatus Daviesbacteria bacterium]